MFSTRRALPAWMLPVWVAMTAAMAATASAAAPPGAPGGGPAGANPGTLRAGAAAIDVSPTTFPVVVNCSFLENTGTRLADPLHARALVLDDGAVRLAIVVVDSCMMPREFLDRAKDRIRDATGIPPDRVLISATHTHTAPAVMACLGSRADPLYGDLLLGHLVAVVKKAVDRLVPAEAGFATADATGMTNNRRWILRRDKVRSDPFGARTVRANMHPGYQHPDFVGPSGPVDPWLSLLSVRTAEGRPLAVMGNFSMHYFGASPVSADYFGRFCRKLETRLGGGADNPGGVVAILSQGTSGDLHWMDYSRPRANIGLEQYAERMTELAATALKDVTHRRDATLAMAETTIKLRRRAPDEARLAWARPIAAKVVDKPRNQTEIYAMEALLLHAEPERELKLQALRVGDVGIAAIPDEVFALSGLRIKAGSPLAATFTIELANGAEGYIPPPEQHVLGGYTTWPARSAALETGAEPRIVGEVLALLEKVAGAKRRDLPDPKADAWAAAVLADRPSAYWRLGDLTGTTAAELIAGRHASHEPGVVYGLPGPRPEWFGGVVANRAAQYAGGRTISAELPMPPAGPLTVEAWVWPGLPADAAASSAPLLALTEGGRAVAEFRPPAEVRNRPREWMHVAWVRDGEAVKVFVDGKPVEPAALPTPAKGDDAKNVKPANVPAPGADAKDAALRLVLGGAAVGDGRFEGRLAEVAVFDRVLTREEIAKRLDAVRGR